jgi:protein tyrosine phosphatase
MLIATPGKRYEIRLKLDKFERTDNMTKRKIKVYYKFQETPSSPVVSGEKVIEHFHYKCWIDQKIPEADDNNQEILKLVKNNSRFLKK